MRKGMYTGTFDPITNGHLDIIKRGALMFDKFYIVIAHNTSKNTLFSVSERKKMIEECVKDFNNIEVLVSDELVVDFAYHHGINFILRGLRAVTDFEYELQMADTNKILNPKIETIFMMANKEFSYLSSSVVKEIASFSKDVSSLVPKNVCLEIEKKFNIKKNHLK